MEADLQIEMEHLPAEADTTEASAAAAQFIQWLSPLIHQHLAYHSTIPFGILTCSC